MQVPWLNELLEPIEQSAVCVLHSSSKISLDMEIRSDFRANDIQAVVAVSNCNVFLVYENWFSLQSFLRRVVST